MKKSYTLSDIAKIFVGNILKNEKISLYSP